MKLNRSVTGEKYQNLAHGPIPKRLWDLITTGVSEFSHEFLVRQLATVGEEIPCSTALLGRRRPPPSAEVEHGRHLI